jgi:outer membrane biosynthesis protein TonB
MRRTKRIVLLITLALAMPVLAGCSNFDPDSLDVFGLNEKKKLPGERRAVFPEGVPGVSQGIPPEYLKGNQPPPDTAQIVPAEPEKPAAKKTAAVEPQKPKRKPKPRPAAAAPTQPVQSAQDPAFERPAQQQQTAPWPAGSTPAPAQSSSSSPWPNAAPPSGTFSR